MAFVLLCGVLVVILSASAAPQGNPWVGSGGEAPATFATPINGPGGVYVVGQEGGLPPIDGPPGTYVDDNGGTAPINRPSGTYIGGNDGTPPLDGPGGVYNGGQGGKAPLNAPSSPTGDGLGAENPAKDYLRRLVEQAKPLVIEILADLDYLLSSTTSRPELHAD